MPEFKRILMIVSLCLLAGAIPFLLLGESFEQQIRARFEQPWSPPARFVLIFGLLAVDIALPIPSSAVSTYGGSILGWGWATLASWLGMMCGSLIGYSLARLIGHRFVDRVTDQQDQRSLGRFTEKFTTWTVVLTRPLPVLAEATMLMLGALKIPLRQILFPLLASNLVIAAAYSAVGAWSIQHDATLAVLIASVIVPLAFTWIVRQYWHSSEVDILSRPENSHAGSSRPEQTRSV